VAEGQVVVGDGAHEPGADVTGAEAGLEGAEDERLGPDGVLPLH
jgi:hypothetical protein